VFRFLGSLSGRILLALAGGIALGALARGYDLDPAVPEAVAAVGSVWLGGLQMTVVPLVFSLIVVGVASATDAAQSGKLAFRSILLFAGLVLLAATLTVLLAPRLWEAWPADREAALGLVQGAVLPEGADEPPTISAWLRAFAPQNPVAAAANSTVLPLVLFAVVFGFAATRLQPRQKEAIVGLFDAVADAMIVVVRWVLLAGPVGVGALAFGVGLQAGAGSVAVLGHYVAVASLASVAVVVACLLLILVLRPVPFGRFLVALAPVHVLAVSTQSSLACLPAMAERSIDVLKLPERIVGLVLPLAVALFRMTSPAANLTVAAFVAYVFGVEPSAAQWIGAVFVAFAVAVASPGLPGQISFIVSIAPICLALGLPVQLLPILLAVEVIPDIFRTVGNVTADMTATALLAKGEKKDLEIDDPGL
jgi:Na+/H+-dicarboxylate symporter